MVLRKFKLLINYYIHFNFVKKLFSGRHKQEESLFEEMLQVSQATVSHLQITIYKIYVVAHTLYRHMYRYSACTGTYMHVQIQSHVQIHTCIVTCTDTYMYSHMYIYMNMYLYLVL